MYMSILANAPGMHKAIQQAAELGAEQASLTSLHCNKQGKFGRQECDK